MVQVVNVKSDGTFEVSFGSRQGLSSSIDDNDVVDDLKLKIEDIVNLINESGISEVHAEKSDWREFVHVVSAGAVSEKSFGTYISQSDFDYIMSYKGIWPAPEPEPIPEPVVEEISSPTMEVTPTGSEPTT